MAIVNILGSVTFNATARPAWIAVDTTDSLATVMGTGYLNGTDVTYGITWTNKAICLVTTSDAGVVWLAVSIVGANTSMIPMVSLPQRSQSSASRTLNSGYQVSTTRDSLVNYSVDVATTISLTTGQTGTVFLEIASDSGFTTNLQELGRFVNGNAGTLTLGLNLTQTVTGGLSGYVPAGYYCRLRTANTVGTPTFTYRSGQEVLM